ncbi:hypothetical protein GCM10027515_07820 [Schumannella luteola]|uniref:Surface-anchored protein n=1 Tax=Schumannella luteola TaxID=472059 RepID=A0A852YGC8_9MICO|nr:TIGR03773 family transporter-associated surface protein [Schumannella luteola]NYG98088.1 surface-anchored protein [Schumannella luteola]TPX01812.1 hypothetical protein FJ656_25835 [Schumannella luteola]
MFRVNSSSALGRTALARTATAAVGGALVAVLALGALPAQAATASTSLEGAALIVLGGTPAQPALLTAPTDPDAAPDATGSGHGPAVDPASVVYRATTASPATVALDPGALPEGSTAQLELALAEGPDGGAATLPAHDDGSAVWASGTDVAAPIALPAGSPRLLDAVFSVAGSYRITVVGSVTDASGAVVTTAPADYRIDVVDAEPAPDPAGDPGAGEQAGDEPGGDDQTDPAETDPAETDPAEGDETSAPAAPSAPGRTASGLDVIGSDTGQTRVGLYAAYRKSGEADSEVWGRYSTAGSFEPVLVDRGEVDESVRTPYAAASTILHLGDTEKTDTGWSSVDEYAEVPGLVLQIGDNDSGVGSQLNSDFRGDSTDRARWTLSAFSGPAGGRLTVERFGAVAWDSSTLASAGSSEISVSPLAGSGVTVAVTEPGRYCLTTRVAAKSKSAGSLPIQFRTFTIWAGDIPADATACDQVGAPGVGGGGTTPPKPVQVVDAGHTDLRVGITLADDGSQRFAWGRDGVLQPVGDFLFSRTPPPVTIPAPAGTSDFTGIGPVGSPYWYFPTTSSSDGADAPNYLWPGFSTESIAAGDIRGDVNIRLNGFSLNGVAQPEGVNVGLLQGSNTESRGATQLNTRLGYPTTFRIGAFVHTHPMWWFTAEGRYCLNLTSNVTLRDGTVATADALVTFLVGDSAAAGAATATTCERETPRESWPVGDRGDRSGASAERYRLTSAADGELQARLDDDGQLSDAVVTGVGSASRHESGHGVVALDEPGAGQSLTSAALGLSTERLPEGAISGPVTLHLDGVSGPGRLTLHPNQSAGTPLLGGGAAGLDLGTPARQRSPYWNATKPGVYCATVHWSATGADGSALRSPATELTFVAGLGADAGAVTPCADGGEPGDLPDGSGGGSDPVGPISSEQIYVPNHTRTASGAVIVNDGHVDVASTLGASAGGSGGARLQTWLKDSSDGVSVVQRPIAGSASAAEARAAESADAAGVVLQLLPESAATVPANPAYSFLGAPGSRVWQVDQTQRSGLIWPGWSTEAIDPAATQGGVSWTLNAADGPGRFALYQDSSVPGGAPELRLRSGDAGHSSFVIPKSTHAHGYWAFGSEGSYCLAFTRSTTLVDGANVKDDFVLAVAVGAVDVRKVDPAGCFNGSVPDGANSGVTPDSVGDAASTAARAAASGACRVAAGGGVVISAGHVDFGTRLVDGRLRSQIKDGSSATVAWREPSQTVVWVKPQAKITSPGGAVASLLGPAGASAWQIPQTQQAGVVWLGWNTESLAGTAVASPVNWRLDAVSGPGSVGIYELGSFGSITPVLTKGGSYSIPLGVHAHGNWAFTAEGVYRLAFTQSATLGDGRTVSDRQTLTIAVGEVDPATALGGGTAGTAADAPAPGCGPASGAAGAAADAASGDDSATVFAKPRGAEKAAADLTAGEQGMALWLLILLIAGGVLVLGAAATGGVLYLRHVRAQVPHAT